MNLEIQTEKTKRYNFVHICAGRWYQVWSAGGGDFQPKESSWARERDRISLVARAVECSASIATEEAAGRRDDADRDLVGSDGGRSVPRSSASIGIKEAAREVGVESGSEFGVRTANCRQ